MRLSDVATTFTAGQEVVIDARGSGVAAAVTAAVRSF